MPRLYDSQLLRRYRQRRQLAQLLRLCVHAAQRQQPCGETPLVRLVTGEQVHIQTCGERAASNLKEQAEPGRIMRPRRIKPRGVVATRAAVKEAEQYGDNFSRRRA